MTTKRVRIIPLEPKDSGYGAGFLVVVLAVFAVLAAAGIVMVAIEASS